jgi:hypothetical protein
MGVVGGVVCVLYVLVYVLHVMWILWYHLLQLYALKPAQVQGGPDDIH